MTDEDLLAELDDRAAILRGAVEDRRPADLIAWTACDLAYWALEVARQYHDTDQTSKG